MKQSILFSILLIILVLPTSCVPKKSELQQVVELANKECPFPFEEYGSVVSIELENRNVVYTILLSNNFPITVNDLKKVDPNILKKMFSACLKIEKDKDIDAFYEFIVKEKAGIVYKFISSDSGDLYRLPTISNDELSEVWNYDDDKTMETVLEGTIAVTNAMCPIYVDDATILTSTSSEGKYVVYNYKIDESLVPISMFSVVIDEVKQSIRENFNDPTMTMFITLCQVTGKGLLYKYVGDRTGAIVTITFEPSEISDL